MNLGIKGKKCLVSGGGRGLGKACAHKLAHAGALVVIADVDGDAAIKTASEIEHARAYQCDFGDVDDIARLHRSIRDDMQDGIDILINNAGIISYKNELDEVAVDEWDRLMDINLKGVFWASREFSEDMKTKRFGKIVNLSSLAARVGGIDVGIHYTASKAGIIGLTRQLAKKLGSYAINVNAVAPGIILTDPVKRQVAHREDEYIRNIPLMRLGVPDDVAHVVLFLSSCLSSYITGCVLDVNGGLYMN